MELPRITVAAISIASFMLSGASHAGLPDVSLETVLEGITDPSFVTHAGDQRLFVTRLGGQVQVVDRGELDPEPFLDISRRIGSGVHGLYSIAFHPDFPTRGFAYVHRVEKGTFDSLVSRFRVADSGRLDPRSEVVLIRVPKDSRLLYGGQVAFGPDGYLYASMGDTSIENETDFQRADPECAAQSLARFEGKILRLDVDRNARAAPYYAIPPDNPFAGGARPEVWALGLRNPWRFAFDRETGDLWIADVGKSSREEVNFRPASSPGGENFGWKVMEASSCFGDAVGCSAPMPPCGAPGLTPPVIEYTHSDGNCAVIGGVVYRGSLVPDLYGHYLYGDHCSGTIWAAKEEDGAMGVHELPVKLPGVVSFGEDVEGEVYLAAEGGVYRVVDETIPEAGLIELVHTELDFAAGTTVAPVSARRLGGSRGAVRVRVRWPVPGAPGGGFSNAFFEWKDGDAGSTNLVLPLTVPGGPEPTPEVVVELGPADGGAVLGARRAATLRIGGAGSPTCVPDATHLCINRGRFRVSVAWRTSAGDTGQGRAVRLGADSGSFWFFSANNPELFVKILDACSQPSRHYWVFAAGLTSVETVLEVVDTATGEVKRYPRPLGVLYETVGDTSAFATCP